MEFDDSDSDWSSEILEAFPSISGLAMYTLNAWADYAEDTINIRPAM